jgi:glutathione S-transferase
MAVRLHRCPFIWLKIDAHACWRVQKALDETGVDYEVVKEPLRPGKRAEVIEKTGQKMLPAIEFEDGRWLREESKDLAARVREGRLTAAQPPG